MYVRHSAQGRVFGGQVAAVFIQAPGVHSISFCVNHGHVGSLLCFIHITFFEGCMRKGLKTLGLGEVACSKQDLLKPITLKSGKAPRSGCGISFLLPYLPGGTAVPEFSESEEKWSCFWFAVGLPSSSMLARPQLAPHAGAGRAKADRTGVTPNVV